jgi:hypothetical protein
MRVKIPLLVYLKPLDFCTKMDTLYEINILILQKHSLINLSSLDQDFLNDANMKALPSIYQNELGTDLILIGPQNWLKFYEFQGVIYKI